MRTIKFKVYRNDTKEIVGCERINKSGQWEHIRINRDEWLLGCITDGQEYVPFIRKQFTGLKDINKTEIYDGDVYKDNLGRIHIVEFHSGGFWIRCLETLYSERLHSDGQITVLEYPLNLSGVDGEKIKEKLWNN